MKQPICVDQAKAGCGEGLLWDSHKELVRWVDISGERLHSFDPNTRRTTCLNMPYLISALALREDGALLIATLNGMARVHPDKGELTQLHDPEPHISGNRLNDILPGPDGQLWVGTMSEGAKGATGSLYRYGPNGPQLMKSNTTISNGMAYSPDNECFYFIDSVPGTLNVFQNGNWRVLFTFDAATGRPDGMTVDTEGTLWIAICDQGRVIGMSPEGEIIEVIDIPCEIVTNCTFGGKDLRTLFITTGTFSMSESEKEANPMAGSLFAVQMDVSGIAPFKAQWPKG